MICDRELAGDFDEPRNAPLEMSPGEFRRAGHRLVDLIADFLARMPSGPVNRDESPGELRRLLGDGRPLPETGADATELLEEAARLLFEHSLFNGHPRFFGYVTSSPAPIGVLGDFLAAAVNGNTGAWKLSPMATEIEAQTIRWISELVGFAPGCDGLLLSGGNMANITALVAARTAAAGWDPGTRGVHAVDAPRLRILATSECHTWLTKGTNLAGLGTDAIHWVATGDDQTMDPAALDLAIDEIRAGGDQPMMVVASAGTVSTGAIDPLFAIAERCRREDIWLHVDGCYGGVAACLPEAPRDLHALGYADSLALDPHKWLYAPLEAGALLVRDPGRLRDAFAHQVPYYHFGSEVTNYVDLGPQNSRGFRALKVWLALRQVGRTGYIDMIREDIRLSRSLARRVEEHDELELVGQNLSVTTFRYVPAGKRGGDDEEQLDRINRELLDRIQRSGQSFLSHAIVAGRFALRACIVNFRTRECDLAATVETIVGLGRRISWEVAPTQV